MPLSEQEHTVKSYDVELAHLRQLVLDMGAVTKDYVPCSIKVLLDGDPEEARTLIAHDEVVDNYDLKIHEEGVNLLVTRQPMGQDLRTIIALVRTATDLERIADEATKIARITLDLFDREGAGPNHQLLRDVDNMARLANAMLENSINALSRLDVEHAVEVVRNDRELDLEFQASLRRLVTFTMEDVRNLGHITNIVLVIKALERIGDHAKNIAEHVVFLVKGKDVRHYTLEALVTDVLGTQWADS